MFLASEVSSYLVVKGGGQIDLENNEGSLREWSEVGNRWVSEIQIKEH